MYLYALKFFDCFMKWGKEWGGGGRNANKVNNITGEYPYQKFIFISCKKSSCFLLKWYSKEVQLQRLGVCKNKCKIRIFLLFYRRAVWHNIFWTPFKVVAQVSDVDTWASCLTVRFVLWTVRLILFSERCGSLPARNALLTIAL